MAMDTQKQQQQQQQCSSERNQRQQRRQRRRPRPRSLLALAAAAAAAAALAAVGPAAAQSFTIPRNSDDCIYPPVSASSYAFWPGGSYLASGTATQAGDGSYVVNNRQAGFSIRYYKTHKVVTNALAGESYLLYHCGSTPPGGSGVAKRFEVPLRSVSCDDASAADAAVQLVMMDRVAYASELAVNNCLQTIVACGYLAPDPNSNDVRVGDVRPSVDAFWTYGAGGDQMSISYSAPLAPNPLRRAEWILYTAAFFNKEWEAGALVAAIKSEYRKLKEAAAKAVAAAGRARVACWVAVDFSGNYAVSKASYKVAYIRDAGGAVLSEAALRAAGLSGGGSYWYMSPTNNVQKWANLLKQCDVIIDETYADATGGIVTLTGATTGWLARHYLTNYASSIPAVANKQVFSLAGTAGQLIQRPGSPYRNVRGLDWFERGVSRPDEVLRDFAKVLTPAASADYPRLSSWTRRWLLQLGSSSAQQVLPATCSLATAKFNDCQRSNLAARICPNLVRNCDTGCMELPPQSGRCDAVSQQNKAIRARVRAGLSPDCLVVQQSSAACQQPARTGG